MYLSLYSYAVLALYCDTSVPPDIYLSGGVYLYRIFPEEREFVCMKNKSEILKLTTTAMLAALASVLMMFEFSTPFIPAFIKFDFSELPGIFAAVAISPWSGVAVCLIKNLVHLPFTTTGCIGEVANFLLGAAFTLSTGYLFRALKGKKLDLIISGTVGSAVMALVSVPINYYVTYPVYMKFMPLEAILNAYMELNPAVDSLWDALLMFNLPFNFVKCMVCLVIAAALFKALRPFLSKFEISKT